MRRLIIPLLVGLTILLSTGTCLGQVYSIYDSLGFYPDTIRQLQDNIVRIPVYMYNDSSVSAVSMIFEFDDSILQPQIVFDRYYDSLRQIHDTDPSFPLPDSTDWLQPNTVGTPGLWYIEVELEDTILTNWPPKTGSVLIPYNLNTPGKAIFLMTPKIVPGEPLPLVPGHLGGDSLGLTIAHIKFRVNPEADYLSTSPLTLILEDTESHQKTEMAQEWYVFGSGATIYDTILDCTTWEIDGEDSVCVDTASWRIDTLVNTDTITVAITPTFLEAIFVVDTADTATGPGPDPEENTPPVMQTISPNHYNISAGETVSFAVAATDEEDGVIEIYANDGNLIANAFLFPSNPIIGGLGELSGTFSFTPDIAQIGIFTFRFKAIDDSGITSENIQVVTIDVEGLETDVLFTTSAENQKPQGGIPGLDQVLVPINIITEKTIYGIQFDLTYDADNFILDSIIPSDRIPDWLITHNVGIIPGELRVVTLGLANDPMVAGSTSAVLYLAFTVDDFALPGCSPLDLSHAIESIDPNPDIGSFDLESVSGVLCVDMLGDINLNGEVEVDDLTGVVGYIIGNFGFSRRRFAIADIIPNDMVNVIDLVGILNTIFGLDPSPSPLPVSFDDEFATLKINHEEIPFSGMSSEMYVEAEMPTGVAGVEIVISYNTNVIDMLDPQLAAGSQGFQMRITDNNNGTMKVLLFSDEPWNESELISIGVADIVTLPFISKAPISQGDQSVRITQAFVSTGFAKNVTVVGMDN